MFTGEGAHPFDPAGRSGPVPALVPWHPADGLEDVELVERLQDVWFTDRLGRTCRIRAQGRSAAGWAVEIEYHTDDTYARWVLHDPARFRDPPAE